MKTRLEKLIVIVLVVAVIILQFKSCDEDNIKEKCEISCSTRQGKVIDDKCHCKTETGWETNETK